MARKNVVAPVVVESAKSLATSFNSAATIIDFMDNIAYQINVTTTNSVGTFVVQASLDYMIGNSLEDGATGNWVDLDLSTTLAVNAANISIMANLNQLPFRAVRLKYTSSVAGTGTCNIIIMQKTVGA